MNKKLVTFSMVLMGFMGGSAYADTKLSGSELFTHHGCVNCHGNEAKDPISKVVPTLAGKPADELFVKAKKILSGEGSSKESQIMHAAFYSPSQCDNPPTDAELKSITNWISKL
ncbi:MAG: c-type cytochrome [Sedimenticola sp.]